MFHYMKLTPFFKRALTNTQYYPTYAGFGVSAFLLGIYGEMNLFEQKNEFLKRQFRAIDNAPKPAASHTTYVPVASRPTTKRKRATADASKAEQNADMAKASAVNAANFGTLAQVVDFMKKRHLLGNTWALALNEILEEMQLDALSQKTINWLHQTLSTNPRLIAQTESNLVKYAYKPPHKIKNRNALIALLKKYYTDGKGALLLSELNDCIPNAAKVIETLGNQVIDVPTQVNKRKDHAYFYNDTNTDLKIDNEFVSLWRNVNVDHIDENKIAEYLQKHGITSVKDLAPHRVAGVPKRKATKRRANTKVQNVHLDGVLQDFDTGT